MFGPVLCIISFDTEEEAVAIANDTQFGLTNYLQARDKKRGMCAARRLRSGVVEINGQSRDGASPLGGISSLGMLGKVGHVDLQFLHTACYVRSVRRLLKMCSSQKYFDEC